MEEEEKKKNLLTGSCSNAGRDVLVVLILNASAEVPAFSSREKVAGALKLKQTNIFFFFSLPQETEKREENNDGI